MTAHAPPFQWTVLMFGLLNVKSWLQTSMFVSGDADSETAALGYFITPCVGTLVTLFCYLLLPRLVSLLPDLRDHITHNAFNIDRAMYTYVCL